jgi:Tfp pilus assembly protein PilF
MTTASQTSGSPAELNALYALAVREHGAGRLTEAIAAYRKILALWPKVAEVHNNLGIALCQQGQFDEARPRFEQALALRPDFAEAHNNLGNLLRQQGKFAEAQARFEQAIALRPDYAEAYNNLGYTLDQLGKRDEAAARYRQALALRPNDADAHNNLGNVLLSQGRLDDAAAHYQQALALRPDCAEACNNLGTVCWHQSKFEQAIARFKQAIALRPDYAEAHRNLGNALRERGQLEQAVAHFERAIALRPGCAEAHFSLGVTHWHQNKLEQAVARFEQAIAIKPDYVEAHNHLGATLREQFKLNEARQAFERLEAIQPDLPSAQLGLAACYLFQEDYERGWPAYEARLRMPGVPSPPDLPRWAGEPLKGRSLLLVAEQGLGDTIQFVRYALALKQRGARVVLAVQPALGRLMASQPDLEEVFLLGSGNEWPRCDFYLPLLSAPGALGTNASTIPSEVPYLWADPGLTEQWRQELLQVEGFKIGIVWQGSRSFVLDRWRSLALAEFAPLARLPGVRLVSLQKGFGAEQVATVDFPVLDLSSRLDETAGPFMDTAAVIRNLDLVLAPDTAIAHLAGALGSPIWVTLPFSSEWRWLRDRDDSPWYPTMRLFRQTRFGQRTDVFERITKAVQARRSETAARC